MVGASAVAMALATVRRRDLRVPGTDQALARDREAPLASAGHARCSTTGTARRTRRLARRLTLRSRLRRRPRLRPPERPRLPRQGTAKRRAKQRTLPIARGNATGPGRSPGPVV